MAKDKFCTDLVAIDKLSNSMGGASDPVAAAKQIVDFGGAMKKVEGRVPKAIKADWQKMNDGVAKLGAGLQKLNKLTPAQAAKEGPKLQAEMTKIGDDKSYSTAGDKVSAWAKKNCGIDLSA